MQKIDIYYNPYKMETILKVNGLNVCGNNDYMQFGEFIEHHTPLQTWVEPIPYKKWGGFINELISDEYYDALEIHFHGRKIDFEDLKRACEEANENREHKLGLSFFLEDELSDKKMAQNIEVVMNTLLSTEFAELVTERGEESAVAKHYANLKKDYEQARDKEFKIVFAGLYSSGKSTILNTLIGREILPTSDDTCTAKTCCIKHDKKIGNKISLECFDMEGKTVVSKQFFDSEEECLNKLWEITPLGETKSNPETVDTIEIGIDLSHLYPSKEMEKDFNLVIVDTPGCNSAKTNTEEEAKRDISIAIDAITGDEKEMVIICADSQDYEDETIGEFLFKIHKESDDDDKGDFNDRFLFVLNKCDLLKYKKGESISLRKERYAEYLSNTRKWGMNETDASPKFVPKIYMVSAYIDFAIKKGVVALDPENLSDEDWDLRDAYESVYTKMIERENRNYFLSENCDIPEYRKREVETEFQTFLSGDKKTEAIRTQMGIVCVESAIKDYIARYAYPFKVRDLLETFDDLLEDIIEFTEWENRELEKRMSDLGKGISEREEVEREQREEEERENRLRQINDKISERKQSISGIYFNSGYLQEIRMNLEKSIESESIIQMISTKEKRFSKEEVEDILRSVTHIFSREWENASREFQVLTDTYKHQLSKLCEELKGIAKEIEKNDKYGLDNFNFMRSMGIAQINKLDEKLLRKNTELTKQTVKEGKYIQIENPVKNETYRWWQFAKKAKQFFAPATINKWIEEEKEVYSVTPVKECLTNIFRDFRKLCMDTQAEYEDDIERLKKEALKMADDVIKDVDITCGKIAEFKNRIKAFGNSISKLNEEIEKINKRKLWLQQLQEIIKVGGE